MVADLMDGEVAIGLRDVVMLCSIIGAMIGFWRFFATRKQDAIDVAVWRKEMEHRMTNAESYSKRIESEYKSADDDHKVAYAALVEEMRKGFESVTKALATLTNGLTEVKVSLREHRDSCESRKT